MTQELNIISIACNLYLAFDEQSNKKESEQLVFENHLNHLYDIAFNAIGNTNRIILTSDNGVVVAYTGLLTDAMLVATNILNEIMLTNKQGAAPLYGRIGIDLVPVRVVSDFTEQPNIIGNVIVTAKQLMRKAKPNEIVVSRAYFEKIPPLIQALVTFHDQVVEQNNKLFDNYLHENKAHLAETNIAQTADFSRIHVDLPTADLPPVDLAPTTMQGMQTFIKPNFLNASNWKYALASLFVVVGLLFISQLVIEPQAELNKNGKTLPIKVLPSMRINKPTVNDEITINKSEINEIKKVTEPQQLKPINKAKITMPKKAIRPKASGKISSNLKQAKKNQPSNWETFKNNLKQGGKKECTQPQTAMNQCH